MTKKSLKQRNYFGKFLEMVFWVSLLNELTLLTERRDTNCTDIVDGLRKLESKVALFVCRPEGFSHIQRQHPDDLNIISIDECLRCIEKSIHVLQNSMTLALSLS